MTEIVNAVFLRGGQVLMAHRSPLRRNYPGSWSFPGGHVEPDETLEQAVVRECCEEVGVAVTTMRSLSVFVEHGLDKANPVTFHMFAVTGWTGEPANLGSEHTEIRWMDVATAASLPGLTFPAYARTLRALGASDA